MSQPPVQNGRQLVKELLRQSGLRAKKSFGQNFFANPARLREIVDLAGVTAANLVVEVGPGMGFLTGMLAARAAKVLAVELDRDLAAFLRGQFAASANVEIVEDDILRFQPPAGPYLIVANLPYYLSSRFLRRFLAGEVARPRRIAVMLQREVAEKLVAPGSSLLQLSVAAYGEPRIAARFEPRDFQPVPKVHSALVVIEVAPAPRIASPEKAFFSVAHSAFQSPRKMLGKSLRAQNLPPEALARAFAETGIDPAARPSTLALADFDRLAGAIVRIRAEYAA